MDTKINKQMMQTGGRPPPDDKNDPLYEMVNTTIPTIDLEIENNWDSTRSN